MREFLVGVGVTVIAATSHAQVPTVADVVSRIGAYVTAYGPALADVVAEEWYRQEVSDERAPGRVRTLRADYALIRATGREAWVGYRDTFELDGQPVRDREERLQHLLATGDIGEAARIADQNARFNLAGDLLSRNVNVPTFALELLQQRNHDRFSFRRAGTERIDGREGWIVDVRERDRPTLVRTPDGRDQPTRILALVDPATGEVLRTTVTWEQVRGSMTVTYGRVSSIPALVPTRMSEQYTTRDGVRIAGEAEYSNYRRFQTSGRIIDP